MYAVTIESIALKTGALISTVQLELLSELILPPAFSAFYKILSGK